MKRKDCLVPVYGRMNIDFVRGAGMELFDSRGRRYLDFLAGIAVCVLGHSHPDWVKAVTGQARVLAHTSNLFRIRGQEILAKEIVRISRLKNVFFCNSGAEANEAALKLVRRYHSVRKTGRTQILSMKNSFHGRTTGAIRLTGQTRYQESFGPYLPGIKYVRFNDSSDLEKKVSEKTAAIFLEVIQGEGGVVPAEDQFIRTLVGLRHRHKHLLIIVDEVQTGIGRTGEWFGFQGYKGLIPDAITLAKGLGGGMPIGALVCAEKTSSVLTKGTHASTFGGNYLASAAGLAVIRTIRKQKLLAAARRQGQYLLRGLEQLTRAIPGAFVRGRGLMAGLVLPKPVAPVMVECLKRGLVIGTAGTNVLRLTPPLIVEKNHIDEALDIIEKSMRKTGF